MDLAVHLILAFSIHTGQSGALGPQSARRCRRHSSSGPDDNLVRPRGGKIPRRQAACAATESLAVLHVGLAARNEAFTAGLTTRPRCRRTGQFVSNTRWCSPSPPTPPLAPAIQSASCCNCGMVGRRCARWPGVTSGAHTQMYPDCSGPFAPRTSGSGTGGRTLAMPLLPLLRHRGLSPLLHEIDLLRDRLRPESRNGRSDSS